MNILKFYVSVPAVMLSSSLVGYVSPIPSLRFWSRALTCYCTLLLCASYGVIASILLRIAGRPTLSQWTTGRLYANLASPLIGWNFDIQGEEILAQNRPAVFISNHQRYIQTVEVVLISSEMDVLMLGWVNLLVEKNLTF